MSSCVELEGPWREALGTTGRLSECRVIRNPSLALRRVKRAAGLQPNEPRGRITSAWMKLDRARKRGAGESEGARERAPGEKNAMWSYLLTLPQRSLNCFKGE